VLAHGSREIGLRRLSVRHMVYERYFRGPAAPDSHKIFCSSKTTKILHESSASPLKFFSLRWWRLTSLPSISRESSLTGFLKECDLDVRKTGRAFFMCGRVTFRFLVKNTVQRPRVRAGVARCRRGRGRGGLHAFVGS